MNGPLIFTIIQLIRALKCVQLESSAAMVNETKIEKSISNATEDEVYNQELTPIIKLLQPRCQCPCKGVPLSPVCGKTTNGQLKTFNSQCHLICSNQCESSERYAIIFYNECPILHPLSASNRKNVYSNINSNNNRRTGLATSGYLSVITPIELECDCSYCPHTKWIRLDYYPICAERTGHKTTFQSWCHFDCENQCVRPTGHTYLYLYKGPCQQDQTEEIIIPRTFSIVNAEPCEVCSLQCKEFFEPVCAKNSMDEFLSFKSHCHLHCHNQCHYQNSKESFTHVYDGHCSWL